MENIYVLYTDDSRRRYEVALEDFARLSEIVITVRIAVASILKLAEALEHDNAATRDLLDMTRAMSDLIADHIDPYIREREAEMRENAPGALHFGGKL